MPNSLNSSLTSPAKLLLLLSLLTKDRMLSYNAKALLKELVLVGDPRVIELLASFEHKSQGDGDFMMNVHRLVDQEGQRLHQCLYESCSLEKGKSISKSEREARGLTTDKSLIYGEIDYLSFARILRRLVPAAGATFYDLGSGTGRAVLAARISQDFGKCVGIELLDGLYAVSSHIVEAFNEKYSNRLSSRHCQPVTLQHSSFLEYDWSDGDVVFANSTCFTNDLMDSLGKQAEQLKPGTFVITFTKGLDNKAFEVLDKRRYKMSWGPATVYIHRRLNHDFSVPVSEHDDHVRSHVMADDDVEYASESTTSSSDSVEGSDSDASDVATDVLTDVAQKQQHHDQQQQKQQHGQHHTVSSSLTNLTLNSDSNAANAGSGSAYADSLNGDSLNDSLDACSTTDYSVQANSANDSVHVGGSVTDDSLLDDGHDDDDQLEDLNGECILHDSGRVEYSGTAIPETLTFGLNSSGNLSSALSSHGSAVTGTNTASPMGKSLFMQDPEVLDSPQGAALLRRKALQSQRKRRLTEETDETF